MSQLVGMPLIGRCVVDQRWSQLIPNSSSSSNSSSEDVSWELVQTKNRGRAICARRRIESGELIFEESPLLMGPIGSDVRAKRHCVGCWVELDTNYRFSCRSNCGLPLCGVTCPKIEEHQLECDLIRSWLPRYDGSQVNQQVLLMLTTIRAFLLDSDRRWLLESMQANRTDGTAKSVRTFCEQFENVSAEFQFLERTSAALNTNAFEVALHGVSHPHLKGLYALSGQLNHNCVPNTRHSTGYNYRMQIHACRDIPAGEEITTSYTKILWDTTARRLHLYRTKQFWCDCARCADPTEMATYLAALKCRKTTCPGKLLPQAPLEGRSDWKCDTCWASLGFGNVCQMQTIVSGVLQKVADTGVCGEEEGVRSAWTVAVDHRLLKRLVWPSNKFVVETMLQILWRESDAKGKEVLKSKQLINTAD